MPGTSPVAAAPDLWEPLRRLLGDGLRTSPVELAPYELDGGGLIRKLPGAVARPRSAADVAAILRVATAENIPVTARGGGITTEGESLTRAGLVLDLKALNHVLEIAPDRQSAVVEAGCYWNSVNEALRPHGLTYCGAPLNLTSSVGGTLCVGGVDVNAFRYGCSADQVLELEVVLPTGDIVRCSYTLDKPLFDEILFGYGQLGVITKARIRVRPYHDVALRYYLYDDVARAIEDMTRCVQDDTVDYVAVLSVMDRVFCQLVAFDTQDQEALHAAKTLPALHPIPEAWFMVRSALRYAVRPHRWSEALYLKTRHAKLIEGVRDPRYMRNGRIMDRTVPFSRLIWRYWGGTVVAIPDLSLTMARFAEGARRGIEVCKRFFPHFSLYCVYIRNFKHRERYALSPIPLVDDPWIGGIEFSPLLEPGEEYPPEHFQKFKEAIYDVGVDLGSRAYRFGGALKHYFPKLYGPDAVPRLRALKAKYDPSGILNPEVLL